jgi:hypothetical protein
MSITWNQLIKTHHPPLEEVHLKSFEEALGCRLPDDYREFMVALNGGRVQVEQSIRLPETGEEVGFVNFFNLTEESGRGSVHREWEHTQQHPEWGMPWALRIADDGGTGFFLLAFRGELKGSVFFAWKEDYWSTICGTEFLNGDRHPDEHQFVCRPFDALRSLIWQFRIKS